MLSRQIIELEEQIRGEKITFEQLPPDVQKILDSSGMYKSIIDRIWSGSGFYMIYSSFAAIKKDRLEKLARFPKLYEIRVDTLGTEPVLVIEIRK